MTKDLFYKFEKKCLKKKETTVFWIEFSCESWVGQNKIVEISESNGINYGRTNLGDVTSLCIRKLIERDLRKTLPTEL